MKLQLLSCFEQISQETLCTCLTRNVFENLVVIWKTCVILLFSFENKVFTHNSYHFETRYKVVYFRCKDVLTLIRHLEHLIPTHRATAGAFTFFYFSAADTLIFSHNQSTPSAFLAASNGVE